MSVFGEFVITLGIALFASIAVSSITKSRLTRLPNLSRQVSDRIFVGLAIAYVSTFGTLSILRHETFHSGGYDLGIFDQVIWNSLHGRLFENSIMLDSTSFLGHHFSPILLALVPLYAVWSDPRALLLVQTAALAIAALPLYWFACRCVGNGIALVIITSYFLFPALAFVNLFEFHEIALATPLLAFVLYFLLRRRYSPFLVCLMPALGTKEEIVFIALALGLFILIVQRERKLGAGLILASSMWGIVVLQIIIPHFHNQGVGAGYFFIERYHYLGENIPEIVVTILTQPNLVLSRLLVARKIAFVLHLLVPLAFIPLAGAEILALGLPTLGYLLISDDPFQTSIKYQYTAPLLPILFFAAVAGIERLQKRIFRIDPADRIAARTFSLAMLIAVAGIGNYYFQSPGPLAQEFAPTQYEFTSHTAVRHILVQRIPLTVPVMAESNFVPHLSQRRFIYQAPNAPDLRQIEYVIADTRFPSYPEYKEIWDQVLASPYFQVLAEQEGAIVKKHAVPTIVHPTQVQFGGQITLVGYTIESAQPARRGETVSLVATWRADQPIRERYIVFVHLVDGQERTWAQGDREPANGWLRTDRWDAGNLIPDRYELELDTGMPPGIYQIQIGLYAVATNARLLTSMNQDHHLLANIEIK